MIERVELPEHEDDADAGAEAEADADAELGPEARARNLAQAQLEAQARAEAPVRLNEQAQTQEPAQPQEQPAVDAEGAEPLSGAEAAELADAGAALEAGAQRPLTSRVEALLFASGQALTPARLARALGVEGDAVRVALTELVARWQSREGAFELLEIAGGYRFMTRPEFHDDVAALRGKPGSERLSPAALETLAVVAYRQPITRAAVEAVRGVQAGPVLRLLIEHDLIKIAGRSDEPGHPMLYGTTRRFLDHFGLQSLDKLPDLKDVLESS